jgi:hypothetical protein
LNANIKEIVILLSTRNNLIFFLGIRFAPKPEQHIATIEGHSIANEQTMPNLSPTAFKSILLKPVKSPQEFGTADIEAALDHVITPGAALPEQVGAFLTGLAAARVELRREIVIAAATFLYSRSIPAVVIDADKDIIVDIVGTGGDGHNTFNVSTTAAIVAAGAGVRVIKVKNVIISGLSLLILTSG